MFSDFDDFLKNLAPNQKARRTPGILYRRGGDRDDWATHGGQNWVPVAVFIQAGAVRWTGAAASSGQVTHTIPAAYYGEPIIFVQVRISTPTTAGVMTRVASSGLEVIINWVSTANVTLIDFFWIAYGGQLRKP
jgi:hypothetical protein